MKTEEAIAPHGGTLVDLFVTGKEREGWVEKCSFLPVINLSEPEIADFELLCTGAYSPLTGFMSAADYRSVVWDSRLASGLIWPLPITCAVDAEVAESLRREEAASLRGRGELLGVLLIEDVYRADKEEEARLVYRTTDVNHPGVRALYAKGDFYVGGRIVALEAPAHKRFGEARLSPVQTRSVFRERGWRSIVAFQTRNPIHRAHEYIQKCALEMVDGLFLHPLVGETTEEDVPADIRMRCYRAILDKYYPSDRTLLAVFPAAMRYAGPREAVFHALVRKNYGCTHFIVGRDHAGIGHYYGSFDAQHIFHDYPREEIGITPMFFDYTFYCSACGNIASAKTCPHNSSTRVFLSGSKVRGMLSSGEELPLEFTRAEVAAVLREAYVPTLAGEEAA